MTRDELVDSIESIIDQHTESIRLQGWQGNSRLAAEQVVELVEAIPPIPNQEVG